MNNVETMETKTIDLDAQEFTILCRAYNHYVEDDRTIPSNFRTEGQNDLIQRCTVLRNRKLIKAVSKERSWKNSYGTPVKHHIYSITKLGIQAMIDYLNEHINDN